jgi:cytoskeleton protein RodZ
MPNDAAEHIMTGQPLPPGAPQVGAGLREVRERLGWALPDIAESLRIRLPYLEAIERGDLAALPGAAYQTGFVRSYAQLLGLDPDEILRRFRAEGLGVSPKAELSFPAPVPDRAVPGGAKVLLGVVVVLAAYGLYFLHSAHERQLAAAVPPVPVELAPLAVPPKLPTPPAAPKQAAPVAVAQAAPAPQVATATPPAGPEAAAPNTALPATTAPPATGPQAATAATPPVNGKTILATADDWVEVTDASGNILFSKVLHAGDSWPVPDEPGLTMTAGNAGGTEISQNGTASAPLGADGAVLHGYVLTPPAATPATPAAAPPAPPASTN